jgi:Mg-chelatase subunit ChlD
MVLVASTNTGFVPEGATMAAYTNEELLARIEELERRLAHHPNDTQPAADSPGADIWFLLDRSGSMASIAPDVVRGFDDFFAEQRSQEGAATVTLIQFDDQDVHDVLVDAKPLHKVRSIRHRFEPRGCTPLFDAIGKLLDRAEHRLARHGGDPADQLVVIFTDGLENASRDWDAQRINARIAGLREAGWTFVFLGANQDSYATGAQMAMAAGSTANFAASPASVAASYRGLSRSVGEFRRKDRARRLAEADDFWGGVKESEETQ